MHHGVSTIFIGVAITVSAHAQITGFTDVTAEAGIDALQDPAAGTPYAPMTGGGAVADFDNDGFQDLFVLGVGGAADKLYMNDADGTFTESAAAWGIDVWHIGYGVAVGDYDADGSVDMYVTSLGLPGLQQPGMNLLYRNNGDGTFTDVAAAAGVNANCVCPDFPDAWGACFGDYDLDGDLDLAVGSWRQPSGGNTIFRNNGDGTFTDATATVVLHDMTHSKTWSPYFLDTNGDRYPELLWVGDVVTSLYLVNDGSGVFTDGTASSGTGLDQFGMGNTAGDFNGDGLPDWYVSSIYRPDDPDRIGNMLYMNNGDDTFTEVAVAAGVDDGGWGWGTVAVDVDHDGRQDIVETNGWPHVDWTGQRSKVFVNNGDGTFTDIAATSGFDHTGQGRGLACIDYDNDGDQDFVVFGFREHVTLYRNDLAGPSTNWIRVLLDTSEESILAPNGYGTKVVAKIGSETQVRLVSPGCGYLSPSEASAHFGLGAAMSVDLRVEWTSGDIQHVHGAPVNQTITVRARPLHSDVLPDECGCDLDLDCDDVVGWSDLLAVLAGWGPCAADCEGDVDDTDDVGLTDVLRVLANWGPCAAAPGGRTEP